jgi:hypothetical protein
VSVSTDGACTPVASTASSSTCYHGQMLGVTQAPFGPTFTVERDPTKPGSPVQFSVIYNENTTETAPAEILHTIYTTGPASSFTVASDLSTASADASQTVGGWLGGAFSYALLPGAVAQPTVNSCGAGSVTLGTLTGAPVAHFDSVGDQSASTGAISTLGTQ